MRQNLVALRAVLDEIDGDSFDTLEGRITFQKRIYLVQALGLDLGYTFVWHHYGPYSSELADDGLLLEAGLLEMTPSSEPLRFTDSAKDAIDAFRRMASTPPGITFPAWLELLSSIHYLSIASGMTDLTDLEVKNSLTERLLAAKPYFADSRSIVDDAFDCLINSSAELLATASE
jgi:hypothetical protein